MLDLSIKDTVQGPKNVNSLSFDNYIENLQGEDNLSIRDKTAEALLSLSVLCLEVPLYFNSNENFLSIIYYIKHHLPLLQTR